MGIQINGATDSITAIDGTIDVVSAIGNAGVVTATAFVGNITGNVTGNINHTSNLELQVGGVTRANIDSDGNLTFSGGELALNRQGALNAIEIGKGQNSNQYAYIDLIGDTTYTDFGFRMMREHTGPNAKSKLQHRGTGDFVISSADSSSLSFETGGSERLRISSGGNLLASGITTSNAGFQFGSSSHYLYQSASDTATLRITSDGPYAQFKDVSGDVQMGSASGDLRLSASGNEKLKIDGNGHLTLHVGKIYGEDNALNSIHLQSTSGNNNHSRIEIGTIQSSDNGGIHFYTAGSSVATRRLTIKGTSGNVGINHDDPNTQLIVRAPGGSGHASSQVHSGDSSTILNMMVVQGSEGRFGMNTNHDLAIYANGLEKARLTKTGSLFIKSLDTVPVNQAEAGHYASTGYNAGHALGLMVKRAIHVSDSAYKGQGGMFLSHSRNVTCDGTTYNMFTLHNREGCFIGDIYVGFSGSGSAAVRHYKFHCYYAASTLTDVNNPGGRSAGDSISASISSSNDAHFFQVTPNQTANGTQTVTMTIVGQSSGTASGHYYTVTYN